MYTFSFLCPFGFYGLSRWDLWGKPQHAECALAFIHVAWVGFKPTSGTGKVGICWKLRDNFAYFSIKTCCGYSLELPQNICCGYLVESPWRNICCGCLDEAILMSTHNICFYGELTKINLQLSSNTLLICCTDPAEIRWLEVNTVRESFRALCILWSGDLEWSDILEWKVLALFIIKYNRTNDKVKREWVIS